MLLARLKPWIRFSPSSVLRNALSASARLTEKRQVVVAGHGEAGVDDVMPDALVAEMDLEAVVEEGEEVGEYNTRQSHIHNQVIDIML